MIILSRFSFVFLLFFFSGPLKEKVAAGLPYLSHLKGRLTFLPAQGKKGRVKITSLTFSISSSSCFSSSPPLSPCTCRCFLPSSFFFFLYPSLAVYIYLSICLLFVPLSFYLFLASFIGISWVLLYSLLPIYIRFIFFSSFHPSIYPLFLLPFLFLPFYPYHPSILPSYISFSSSPLSSLRFFLPSFTPFHRPPVPPPPSLPLPPPPPSLAIWLMETNLKRLSDSPVKI